MRSTNSTSTTKPWRRNCSSTPSSKGSSISIVKSLFIPTVPNLITRIITTTLIVWRWESKSRRKESSNSMEITLRITVTWTRVKGGLLSTSNKWTNNNTQMRKTSSKLMRILIDKKTFCFSVEIHSPKGTPPNVGLRDVFVGGSLQDEFPYLLLVFEGFVFSEVLTLKFLLDSIDNFKSFLVLEIVWDFPLLIGELQVEFFLSTWFLPLWCFVSLNVRYNHYFCWGSCFMISASFYSIVLDLLLLGMFLDTKEVPLSLSIVSFSFCSWGFVISSFSLSFFGMLEAVFNRRQVNNGSYTNESSTASKDLAYWTS